MVNYQLGKLYMITNLNNTMRYIGATCVPLLAIRKAQHGHKYQIWLRDNTQNYYTSFEIFRIYGFENCRIELIKLFPCNTKDELRAEEGRLIRTMDCVNIQIPRRIPTEYYRDNHNVIRTHANVRMECDCGRSYVRNHRSHHIKGTFHMNYINSLPGGVDYINSLPSDEAIIEINLASGRTTNITNRIETIIRERDEVNVEIINAIDSLIDYTDNIITNQERQIIDRFFPSLPEDENIIVNLPSSDEEDKIIITTYETPPPEI